MLLNIDSILKSLSIETPVFYSEDKLHRENFIRLL